MAIASIIANGFSDGPQGLLKTLRSFPQISEIQQLDAEKIAAVVECPVAELPGLLKNISTVPGMLDMELVFVNYEDDMDEAGFMNCPSEAELLAVFSQRQRK